MVVSKEQRLKRELDSAIAASDMELALAVCDDMVDLDPDRSEYHVSTGVVLAKLGRSKDSVEALDEAIRLDDKNPKAWYSKGCVLMDNGKKRPALACFYKSLDIDPSHQKARNRFIRCLDQMAGADEQPVQKELYYEGPSIMGSQKSEEESTPDRDEATPEESFMEAPPLPEEEPDFPGRTGRSLLDDDLFDEDEEWEEDEEWDDQEDEWEDEEEWDDEEDEEEEPVGYLQCRCGADIPIYSEERPYRFECPDCGRKGTLK